MQVNTVAQSNLFRRVKMWTFPASGVKKLNTFCSFAWTKARTDDWIFVFVCGLLRRKKVSTPAWRNTKMFDICRKKMNDFPHLLKLTINHQLMSKTAFLCQKHGWPGAYFLLVWSLLANWPEMCIFFSAFWILASFPITWSKVWTKALPMNCMINDWSWKRNTNYRTDCTAWHRPCSQFGPPVAYTGLGLGSYTQILI